MSSSKKNLSTTTTAAVTKKPSAISKKRDALPVTSTTTTPVLQKKQRSSAAKTVTLDNDDDDDDNDADFDVDDVGKVKPKKQRQTTPIKKLAKKEPPPKSNLTPAQELVQILAAAKSNGPVVQDLNRPWIGTHVQGAGNLANTVLVAASLGCPSFALDLRSKRQWNAKPLDPKTATEFRANMQKYGYGPKSLVPHGSYLMNCASSNNSENYAKSKDRMLDEVRRCETLGIHLWNFHPGSRTHGESLELGIKSIADAINETVAKTPGSPVVILLENMANTRDKTNVVGGRFEHLRDIIAQVQDKSRVGVCFDTCHAFSAGYDMRDQRSYETTMAEFDRIVGFQYLKAVHLNDSKAPLGDGRDLHQTIGAGEIGADCFKLIVSDPRFKGIPMVLETPCLDAGGKWSGSRKELEMLNGFFLKK